MNSLVDLDNRITDLSEGQVDDKRRMTVVLHPTLTFLDKSLPPGRLLVVVPSTRPHNPPSVVKETTKLRERSFSP